MRCVFLFANNVTKANIERVRVCVQAPKSFSFATSCVCTSRALLLSQHASPFTQMMQRRNSTSSTTIAAVYCAPRSTLLPYKKHFWVISRTQTARFLAPSSKKPSLRIPLISKQSFFSSLYKSPLLVPRNSEEISLLLLVWFQP